MDMHFYYYATCLAARLAGMKPAECQQLAYYCQTMSETTALMPWQYRNYQFRPCLMGAGKEDLESRGDDSWVVSSYELAFTRLPALQSAKEAVVFSRKEPSLKSKAPVDNYPFISKQVTRHYYNPLTDVDWQQGGQFKSAFSHKLASRHVKKQNRMAAVKENSNAFDDCLQMPSSSKASDTVLNMDNHTSYLDSRLNCTANSQFSRDMLNDTICKSRYRSPVIGIDLALLGCRLFVYQNTWKTAEISRLDDGYAEDRVNILLDAFYWTVYVIECFLQHKKVENKRQWQQSVALDRNYVLTKQLKALFAMNGTSLQIEYMWLSQFSQLFTDRGTDWPAFTNWREGLRYRPDHLLEQAMLAADADDRRKINDLQSFKSSYFYKLNKAGKYHADWLAGHLNSNGLTSYATVQRQAKQNMWQQI